MSGLDEPPIEALERAAAALEDGDPTEARRVASHYVLVDDLDRRHDALHIIAHAWFAEHEFGKASEVFGELANERRLPIDWFQLATSCALASDVESAEKAFQNCLGSGEMVEEDDPFPTPEPTMLQRWYALALRDAGFLRTALEHVEELIAWHVQHAHTDDEECEAAGFPAFSHNIELAEELLRTLGPKLDVPAWTEHFAEVVGDAPVTGRLIEYARRVGAD